MVGAACWFIGLQVLELKAFCPYCLGAHACALAAAVLVLWHCPVAGRTAPLPAEGVSFQPGTVGLLAALGLVAPAVLVAGQLFGNEVNAGSDVSQLRPAGPSLAREVVSPTGKPEALPRPQKVVVELFDYTCEHCRRLHQDLIAAQERYGDQLIVAPRPMAMCTACNPYVQKTAPGHEQACDYARLALAVKSVDVQAFARLHAWLMDGPQAPPLEVARQHAAELIGGAALERAARSQGVEAELQQNIALYAATGQGKIPKLIFEDHSVLGGLPKRAQLFQVLEQHAGVKIQEGKR
jgi:protein-disulfide isomerase